MPEALSRSKWKCRTPFLDSHISGVVHGGAVEVVVD